MLHWPGIEPGPPAWQARILPLNHQCLFLLVFWIPSCLNLIFKMVGLKVFAHDEESPVRSCSSLVWWSVSPPVTRETGVQFPDGEIRIFAGTPQHKQWHIILGERGVCAEEAANVFIGFNSSQRSTLVKV